MDSRDSSFDETRPLNPDGDQEAPPPFSSNMVRPTLTPPPDEYLGTGERRELGIRLILVLRLLTVIFTFSNIIVEMVSHANSSIEEFLLVWDWFILILSVVFLLHESRGIGTTFLPTISIAVGERSFHLAGATPDRGYLMLSEGHILVKSKGPREAIRNIIDLLLTILLFIFTIVSTNGRWRRRYWHDGNGTTIDVLHIFVL
jgi:hypothetical protein